MTVTDAQSLWHLLSAVYQGMKQWAEYLQQAGRHHLHVPAEVGSEPNLKNWTHGFRDITCRQVDQGRLCAVKGMRPGGREGESNREQGNRAQDKPRASER